MRRLLLFVLPALVGACADDSAPKPVTFDPADAASMALAQRMAEDYAHEAMDAMDMRASTMETRKVEVDELGMAHVRMRQMLGDTPVWTGELIVHLAPDGALDDMTMDVMEGLAPDMVPDISADEAIELALGEHGGPAYATREPTADRWVMRLEDGSDHLVYRVRFEHLVGKDDEDSLPVMFVDAQSGAVVKSYNNLQTTAVKGQGYGNFYTIVDLDTWQEAPKLGATTYFLEDRGRNFGVYSYRGGTTTLYFQTDGDNKWGGNAYANAGVDAHWAAAKYLDFLKQRFGRNGLDGNGGPGWAGSRESGNVISLITNYATNYNNAGWYDSSYAYFGDGDGTTNKPFTAFDIVVHELTHGLTQYTAGLVYEGQSGALNEANSDIFGAVVERAVFGPSLDNWEHGEDQFTPNIAGDARRYLFYPLGDRVSPDFYAFRNLDPYNDDGGVHTNSGIPNLAFYLLSEGGSNRTCPAVSVTGISADAALALWYRAMRYYWSEGTDFSDARAGLLSAAAASFGNGSLVYKAVQDAWAAVGVGAASNGSANACGTSRSGTLRDHETQYFPSASGKVCAEGAIGAFVSAGGNLSFLGLYVEQQVSGQWQEVRGAVGDENRKSFEIHAPAGTYRIALSSGYGIFDYALRYRLP